MAKYHVNPETGNPGLCKAAKGKCPFGESVPHGDFKSKQEAHDWAERVVRAQFGNSFASGDIYSQGQKPKTLFIETPQHILDEGREVLEDWRHACESKESLSTAQLGRRNSYVEKVTNYFREAGESTNEKFTSPRDDGTVVYHPWRRQQQMKLIARFIETHVVGVPAEGKAIFAGGLGGAGKGTILAEHANIDRSQYVTINPDDIKEEMAKAGMIPEAEGLTPMEMSTLVHEEASAIASEIAGVCQRRKINLIFDGTMGSEKSVERKITNLTRAGYSSIDAIFVSIEPDTSKARGVERYALGIDSYIKGTNPIGGRPLPTHVVDNQTPKDKRYRSRNEEVLVAMYKKGSFTGIPRIYDNNKWGQAPQEIALSAFIQE